METNIIEKYFDKAINSHTTISGLEEKIESDDRYKLTTTVEKEEFNQSQEENLELTNLTLKDEILPTSSEPQLQPVIIYDQSEIHPVIKSTSNQNVQVMMQDLQSPPPPMPPPPPPMFTPPFMSDVLKHKEMITEGEVEGDVFDEDLQKLLEAWYWAGYQAGLYKSKMDAKKPSNLKDQ